MGRVDSDRRSKRRAAGREGRNKEEVKGERDEKRGKKRVKGRGGRGKCGK